MTYSDPDLDEGDELEGDEEESDPLIKRLRSKLRESQKSNKQLQKEVAENMEARKKLAFIEAKLPDEPQVKFFLDHYEGDYSAEAIRNSAAQYGFIAVESPEQTEEISEIESMIRANTGSTAAPAPGTDDELMERINQVKPGPNASRQIAQIMRAAGRMPDDE